MRADDEDRLAFREQRLARRADGRRSLAPAAHAPERIEVCRQRFSGELRYEVCIVQQNDRNSTDDNAGSEPGFDLTRAIAPSLVPKNGGRAKQWDDGWRNPVRKHARMQRVKQM